MGASPAPIASPLGARTPDSPRVSEGRGRQVPPLCTPAPRRTVPAEPSLGARPWRWHCPWPPGADQGDLAWRLPNFVGAVEPGACDDISGHDVERIGKGELVGQTELARRRACGKPCSTRKPMTLTATPLASAVPRAFLAALRVARLVCGDPLCARRLRHLYHYCPHPSSTVASRSRAARQARRDPRGSV